MTTEGIARNQESVASISQMSAELRKLVAQFRVS